MDSSDKENPSAWDNEVIEIDDENDPRYVTGVSPTVIDPSDSAPLPPIDFAEREDYDA